MTTVEQGDLFAITQEAVQRAADHADTDWLRDAARAVRTLAAQREPFTTDDVWALLNATSTATTHEPRALGAVIRQAQRDELIRTTGEWRKSTRPECHTRPCAVWIAAD